MVIFFFFFFDEETGMTEKMPVENLPAEITQEQFEYFNDNIRYVWHKQEQEYYFSVIDVIGILTEQNSYQSARNYWKVTKKRLIDEGAEPVTICNQLKLPAADGKMRMTDVANIEQLLRIIQSVPSPKAEPIKQWLAKVGKERLEEMADPEIAFHRAVEYYQNKGYSDKWITQRLRAIEVRKELTDEWRRAGIKGSRDFSILTSIITKAWSGMKPSEYKEFKGLRKESLRDNMTNTELALNLLAEVSTTELSKEKNPQGLKESASIANQGGTIAGNARKELEQALGRSVISPLNASNIKLLDEE